MPPADRRLRASSIASSSASLVPEPIEKCAVCAASPISTTGTLRGPRGVSSAFQCTQVLQITRGKRIQMAEPRRCVALLTRAWPSSQGDRKSTRLNSSHLVISYAVFCLKKKKNRQRRVSDSPPRPAPRGERGFCTATVACERVRAGGHRLPISVLLLQRAWIASYYARVS